MGNENPEGVMIAPSMRDLEAMSIGIGSSRVHVDDLAVDRFAVKMKAKLARARAKGRGGWDNPTQCSAEKLSAMLHDHVAKGDPVDVANFAMMIEHYGARIAPDWRGPFQYFGGLLWLIAGVVLAFGIGALA